MKIALAQMDIIWENKSSNMNKCEKFLGLAKENAVDFIIFPEMSLTGFSMNVDAISEGASGETVKWLKNMSVTYGLYIGLGYARKSCNKYYNDFIVSSPDGDIVSNYSKIHPFSFGFEGQYYSEGNNLSLFSLKDFTVSPFICYDLRFPEIFQIVSRRAGLITVAANWPVSRREQWLILLKARALENQCYIAGVNRAGYGGGLTYTGDSIIVDPLGNIVNESYISLEGYSLTEPVNCEAMITGNIDLETVNKIRRTFPLKKDRKEDLYFSLNEKYK